MDDKIFYAVEGLLIEKIKRVLWGRQMAIHTVGNKALGIVDVGGCFPGVVGKLNLVTGGTEFGGRGPYHGIIGDAKQGNIESRQRENVKLSKPLKYLKSYPQCYIFTKLIKKYNRLVKQQNCKSCIIRYEQKDAHLGYNLKELNFLNR